MRVPEFVPIPEPDAEQAILARSLAQLAAFRDGQLDELEMTIPDEGLRYVSSRADANKIGRALRKMWKPKYPELFEVKK